LIVTPLRAYGKTRDISREFIAVPQAIVLHNIATATPICGVTIHTASSLKMTFILQRGVLVTSKSVRHVHMEIALLGELLSRNVGFIMRYPGTVPLSALNFTIE